MLFKVALETIMRRLKEYEADCDKKGLKIEKYGHLDKAVDEEQAKILQLNDQIAEVEKQYQECQNQFKELVKREFGDLHEQKNHYKQKYEEAKTKSREL
jgi:predicted  nucleic acid-binding Zn-ribbon protein